MFNKNTSVKDCGCDDTTTTSGEPCTDCVDGWKKELESASNEWVIKTADLEKITAKHTNELAWNTKLKKYVESLLKTDGLAEGISTEIETFKKHLGGVEKHARCTVNALEFLSCEVWKNYKDLDELLTNLTSLESEIKTLKDPDLETGAILKCITDYKTKVKVALDTVTAVIPKVLEALKEALIIYEMIFCKCEECGCEANAESCTCGLSANLTMIHKIMKGTDIVAPDCEICYATDFCIVKFPLEGQDNCHQMDSDLQDTKHKFDKSEIKIKELKVELQDLTQKLDAITLRKNGLTKAILAATDAQKC